MENISNGEIWRVAHIRDNNANLAISIQYRKKPSFEYRVIIGRSWQQIIYIFSSIIAANQ